MKRGFIFTIDAMIALGILVIIVITTSFVKFETILPEKEYEKLNYVADDTMDLLSYLRVEEVQDKPTIRRLVEEGILTERDLEKSVLDLIASFWYKGNETIAWNITEEVVGELLEDFCFNLTVDTETIYSSCSTPANDTVVSTRIESGYEPGLPTYGYIARAYLTSIRGKKESAYVYFGGYVGEGNITRMIELPSFDRIVEAYMELGVNSNFTLYINGNYSGFYANGTAGGGNMSADKWVVCNETFNPSYCSNFTAGVNTIQFNFTGNRSFIGGGYFKVVYDTSQLAPEEDVGTERYWFPGIHGFINLYSSFYVPGDLESMFIYLHYKNNYTTYLTIGNVTVFEENSTEEQTVEITNSTLSSMLNYTGLSRKTIPIRFGTRAFAAQMLGNADVILITDLSGSMDWRLDSEATGIERECDDPDLYDPSTKRISLAKCLDKEFIEIILNASGNRVGLVGFYGDADPPYKGRTITHNLSTDRTSLYDHVDNYFIQDGTCICCGINRAYNILNEQSNASRRKFIVVMSDGIPTHQCGSMGVDECQGTRDGSPGNEGLWLGSAADCYGGADDCDTVDCLCAMENANWSSCRARQDLNATVYSIGFGPVATCWSANWTLRAIADCGDGSYYASSNATELKEIYRTIAQRIAEVSYAAQMVEIRGDVALDSILYPDSFIEFNFTPTMIPSEYGEISLTKETERFGGDVDVPYKESWFNVSEDVRVVEARVTSYSSQYWTDRLRINSSATGNWTRVYWLGDYGSDYQTLGDPYIAQIPANLIGVGNNSIRIGTGISPENATGGSPDDRVIYTIRFEGSVGYGNVFNSSQDAVNDAVNRLLEKVSSFVDVGIENIVTQNETVGGIRWLWGPSLLKIIVWER
jgi:ribosomal protein S19